MQSLGVIRRWGICCNYCYWRIADTMVPTKEKVYWSLTFLLCSQSFCFTSTLSAIQPHWHTACNTRYNSHLRSKHGYEPARCSLVEVTKTSGMLPVPRFRAVGTIGLVIALNGRRTISEYITLLLSINLKRPAVRLHLVSCAAQA